MSEIVVAKNEISPLGIRRIELMRMGEAINRDDWSHLIPPEVPLGNLVAFGSHETDLDVYQQHLSWHAREPVLFRHHFPMVWWWLAGMNVRLGVDCAAAVYRQAFGDWPGAAWIKRLPKKATKTVAVTDGDAGCDLPLKAAWWVPVRFVIVCNELEAEWLR